MQPSRDRSRTPAPTGGQQVGPLQPGPRFPGQLPMPPPAPFVPRGPTPGNLMQNLHGCLQPKFGQIPMMMPPKAPVQAPAMYAARQFRVAQGAPPTPGANVAGASQPTGDSEPVQTTQSRLDSMLQSQLAKITKTTSEMIPSDTMFDRNLKWNLPLFRTVEITNWSLKNCTAGLKYEDLRLGTYISEKNAVPLASYPIRHLMAGICVFLFV